MASCVVAQVVRRKVDMETLTLGAVCIYHRACWTELENVPYHWAAVPTAESQSF